MHALRKTDVVTSIEILMLGTSLYMATVNCLYSPHILIFFNESLNTVQSDIKIYICKFSDVFGTYLFTVLFFLIVLLSSLLAVFACSLYITKKRLIFTAYKLHNAKWKCL